MCDIQQLGETLQKIEESYDFFESKEGFIAKMNHTAKNTNSPSVKKISEMLVEDAEQLFTVRAQGLRIKK